MDTDRLQTGPGCRKAKAAKILRGVDQRIAFRDFKDAMHIGLLAKQFGVKAAEDLAPAHPTLGDVTTPEELERYQEWKRAYKKAAKGA